MSLRWTIEETVPVILHVFSGAAEGVYHGHESCVVQSTVCVTSDDQSCCWIKSVIAMRDDWNVTGMTHG